MDLRGVLELLGKRTGVELSIGGNVDDTRWHPARSASVSMSRGDDRKVIGVIGQVADANQNAFGVVRPVFAIDLDLETLMPYMRKVLSYAPVSEFPVVTRDISFIVSERTEFAALEKMMTAQNILVQKVALVDIYRGKGVEEGKKSMTLSITFASADRTLTSEEVEEIMITVAHNLTGQFGAVLRS
jgi:phenylalanyl-tRNA synthetase beta chain